MWYLKFKLRHSDCIISPLAEKYNLKVNFYPLGHYIEGKNVFVSAIHLVKGNEKNIKKYIKDFKNDKRIVQIEVSKVIFTRTKEPSSLKTYQAIYNPKLFYITPGFNSPDGNEVWELACWNRKPLEDLIAIMRKAKTTINFEIMKFKEKNMDDIYILQLFPELPKKQKQAVEIAYKLGYYQFPRKINLGKIAEIVGISKATLHENLRKAEAKLMPALIR